MNRDGISCGVGETFKIPIKPTFSVFASIESTLVLNLFNMYTLAYMILCAPHFIVGYGMYTILHPTFLIPSMFAVASLVTPCTEDRVRAPPI